MLSVFLALSLSFCLSFLSCLLSLLFSSLFPLFSLVFPLSNDDNDHSSSRLSLCTHGSDLCQSACTLAHSQFGEHVRIMHETTILVQLCKPRATWNEVGLQLCWKWVLCLVVFVMCLCLLVFGCVWLCFCVIVRVVFVLLLVAVDALDVVWR